MRGLTAGHANHVRAEDSLDTHTPHTPHSTHTWDLAESSTALIYIGYCHKEALIRPFFAPTCKTIAYRREQWRWRTCCNAPLSPVPPPSLHSGGTQPSWGWDAIESRAKLFVLAGSHMRLFSWIATTNIYVWVPSPSGDSLWVCRWFFAIAGLFGTHNLINQNMSSGQLECRNIMIFGLDAQATVCGSLRKSAIGWEDVLWSSRVTASDHCKPD